MPEPSSVEEARLCAFLSNWIYDTTLSLPDGWEVLEKDSLGPDDSDSSSSMDCSSFSCSASSKKIVEKHSPLMVAAENKSKNQLIIVFRGTDPKNIDDLKQDFEIYKGAPPVKRIERALQFVKQYRLKKTWCCSLFKSPPKKVILTGHSLGAAIAEYVSLTLKIPCITFESPGISRSRVMLSYEEQCKLITAYLSEPNHINCAQSHVGRVFYVRFVGDAPSPSNVHFKQGVSLVAENKVVQGCLSTYPKVIFGMNLAKSVAQSESCVQINHSLELHKMQALLNAFTTPGINFIEIIHPLRWPNYEEFTNKDKIVNQVLDLIKQNNPLVGATR
jgi:hypothetical protein